MPIVSENSAGHAPLTPARYAPPHMLVEMVERRRLLDRIAQVRGQKAVLVRAPGGFGKTSLLVQWWNELESEDLTRIWLGLGAQYNEPDTFIAGLVEAARIAGIDIALPQEQGPLSGNAGKLAQHFAETLAHHGKEIVFFLDDYHLIRSERVDSMLDELLRNSGPHIHFVIATRRTPGIAVQTLRIEGQLSEIGFQDLSFTKSEMTQFFGSALDEDALATLAHKTEGWPAALQMINLGLAQGQDIDVLLQEFSGQHHEVAAYLGEKILKSLPEDTVDFLVNTSILSLVNGDIADFICERTDGWTVLDSLDELGAFLIPINAERKWYRYHDLFADFLRNQLQHRARAEIKRLHERASIWHEEHGQTINAVHHALASNDLKRVELLIEAADTGSFWLMNRFGDYIELVNRLPADVIERLPRLRGVRAIQLIKEGAMEDGRAMLETVRKELAGGDAENARLALDLKLVDAVLQVYLDGPVDLELVADLEDVIENHPGDLLTLAALQNALTLFYHRLGEFEKARDAAQSALELYLESGSRYGAVFMHLHRGMFALVAGRLETAFRCYQRGEDLFTRYNGDPDLDALIALFKSEALYERGALDAADDRLAESLERASAGDSWLEVLIGGYRSAAALAFAADGYTAAAAVLDRAEAVAGLRSYARLAHWAQMRRIYLAAVAGEVEEARNLCARYGADSNRGTGQGELSWRETLKRRLAVARLALADGRYAEAADDLRGLREEAFAHKLGRLELKTMLLETSALIELNRMDEAIPLAERLLDWTRAERMPSIILEEGSLALDMLESYVRQVGLANLGAEQLDWIAELMARASEYRAGASLGTDPFSARELDVIEALRDNLPTKRIADTLEISDSAVAFHLKNIFKKVGVKNRHLVIPVAEKRQALANGEAPPNG